MLGGIARVLLMALAIVVVIEGAQFVAQGSDYWLYRYFEPRREAARRQVFEQTRSFNEGMAQELWAMRLQYQQADAAGKASLRSIIVHRTADYDTSRLPPELASFVEDMRHGEAN